MDKYQNKVVEGLEDDEPIRKPGPFLFGRDLSKEPCLRSTGIYSILGGIGAGLIHYVATGNPWKGYHTTIGASGLIGLVYYINCGINHVNSQREIRKIHQSIENYRLLEGTKDDPIKRKSPSINTKIDVDEQLEKQK